MRKFAVKLIKDLKMTPEENNYVKSLKDRSDIFNHVVDHLLRQGKRSVDDRGSCAYRGSDGAMCAAGCLIADDEYDPSFEGQGVNSIVYDTGSESIDRLFDHIYMLTDLQEMHDNHLKFKEDSGEFSEETIVFINALKRYWNIK